MVKEGEWETNPLIKLVGRGMHTLLEFIFTLYIAVVVDRAMLVGFMVTV